MKRFMIQMMVVFGTLMVLTIEPVIAETVLTSAPLPGGTGGLTCACTNLTKKSIDIRLEILTSIGGGTEENLTLIPFGMRQVEYGSTTANAICRASKQNGRTITTKQVACSFFSKDSTGRLMVPLDKKLKK